MTEKTAGGELFFPPESLEEAGRRILRDRLCVFFEPSEVELARESFTDAELSGFSRASRLPVWQERPEQRPG